MAQPYLSVVIPAYNEAERLPLTLADIDAHLRKAEFSYEILVVNDGSRDATADIVKKMARSIKFLTLIDNAANKGKGGVVRQGMLAAKGAFRLFADADNSTSLEHFQAMAPYFKEGYDVVIGSRALRGSRLDPPEPFYRRVLGKGSNLIIQATNVPGIWDTQCGFKAFTAAAAEKIFSVSRITGWGFDIEVLALARHFGFRIKEIPVHWVNSPSSHVKFRSYLKTFAEDITIRLWLWAGVYDRPAAASEGT